MAFQLGDGDLLESSKDLGKKDGAGGSYRKVAELGIVQMCLFHSFFKRLLSYLDKSDTGLLLGLFVSLFCSFHTKEELSIGPKVDPAQNGK